MTIDPIAQMEASQRTMALSIAQQKLGPLASIEELIAEAEKIVVWLKTGKQPEKTL